MGIMIYDSFFVLPNYDTTLVNYDESLHGVVQNPLLAPLQLIPYNLLKNLFYCPWTTNYTMIRSV